MNWLLVAVVAVLVGYIIHGYQKGLLRVIFSLFSLVITMIFVTWATPYISDFLKENTQVYQKIEEKCEEKVKAKSQGEIEEQTEQESSILESCGIVLPESIKNNVLHKTNEGANQLMESGGIYSYLSSQLADFVINGIAFFAALIICSILLHFLQGVIDLVSKIPMLKGVNKVLGLGAGLLQGLIIVWLFFYFVGICQTTELGQSITAMIADSSFLSYLYKNNMVLDIITLFIS